MFLDGFPSQPSQYGLTSGAPFETENKRAAGIDFAEAEAFGGTFKIHTAGTRGPVLQAG